MSRSTIRVAVNSWAPPSLSATTSIRSPALSVPASSWFESGPRELDRPHGALQLGAHALLGRRREAPCYLLAGEDLLRGDELVGLGLVIDPRDDAALGDLGLLQAAAAGEFGAEPCPPGCPSRRRTPRTSPRPCGRSAGSSTRRSSSAAPQRAPARRLDDVSEPVRHEPSSSALSARLMGE